MIRIAALLLLVTCLAYGQGMQPVGGVTVVAASGGCTDTKTDSQETDSDYENVGQASGNIWVATSFTAGSSYTLCKLEVLLEAWLYDPGITPTITAYIYSDSSNTPGSVVANGTMTNAPVDMSGWTDTSKNWLSSDFSGVSLTSSTVYWIVLKISGLDAGGSYPRWRVSSTAGSTVASSDGTTWGQVAAYQADFRTYR